MTRNSFRKLSFILTAVVLFSTLYLSTTYATLAPLTPPPLGGYDAGANSILDPGCTPTDTDCFVKEFEGWKLTGNTGTTAGTNFIGTTDAQDFMVKTNGNQIALFGQNGNVAIGSANVGFGFPAPTASGAHSFATGIGSTASGIGATAFGLLGVASGNMSMTWGMIDEFSSLPNVASGDASTAFGEHTTASGLDSTAWGVRTLAGDFASTAFGIETTASGYGAVSFGGNTTASGIISTAFGITTVASGDFSVAFGTGAIASGETSTAFGMGSTASGNESLAFNNGAVASGDSSVAIGNLTIASGNEAFAFGRETVASGNRSTVFGYINYTRSYLETALGSFNTDYTTTLFGEQSFNEADRQFSIGNGYSVGNEHNAYTMWKDGSFAYNDDNFQNDSGGEQNMFYFNYGNHDGLGSAQLKRAIRLGIAVDNEWDINSVNVGDRSIAIGMPDFNNVGQGLIASGSGSISIGATSTASGDDSIAIGNNAVAIGDVSFALGESSAYGNQSIAIGNQSIAYGSRSIVFGHAAGAYSFAESATGSGNTSYTPNSATSWSGSDRIFIIGNGDGSLPVTSDAFTILKNGKTGIGIDNFETTASSALLQVGDSSWTGDMARFQNSAGNCTITNPTGWTCSSDERLKTNINTLANYGLDSVLALRPVMFDWTHGENPTSTIGFIAQEVQAVIPNIVTTDHESGFLSLNTTQMTPIIIKAIQEMNLNITDINNTAVANTWRDALISWFGNVGNGIQRIFTKTIRVQNGVEMIDHATGEIYCTFIENGEFKKVAGECTDTIITTNSPTVPIVSPDPIIDTASDPTTDPVVDPATDPIVTSPEIPTDTPVVSDPVSSDPAPEPVTTTE